MKRLLPLAIVIACAVVVYLINRPKQSVPPVSKPIQTASPKIEKEEEKKASQQAKDKKIPRARDQKIPGEVVEFKVDDGLAIAFGDVILGEVEPNINITEGFYKPVRPRLWKDNEIPYFIDPDLPNPQRVKDALSHFESNTAIRFIEFEDQEDALVFVEGEQHCYSYLGRIGGHQPIKLSDNCTWTEILHEVMHSLGFIHEHTRTDRDEYVKVHWDNIQEEYHNQFAMVPEPLMEAVKGTKFDYKSVMLYPPNAFAINKNKPALSAKGGSSLAPRQGLSATDIERINELYAP